MRTQITALILDDDTISIDGRTLAGKNDVADAIGAALQRDPDVILVIEPTQSAYYKGVGTVVYASQRVGMPVENLRYMTEDREVITFDALRTRNPTTSA